MQPLKLSVQYLTLQTQMINDETETSCKTENNIWSHSQALATTICFIFRSRRRLARNETDQRVSARGFTGPPERAGMLRVSSAADNVRDQSARAFIPLVLPIQDH